MKDRYWIIVGQSNAIGSAGQAADFQTVTDITVNPDVLIHNNATGVMVPTSGSSVINDGAGVFEPWDLTQTPLQHSGNGSTTLAPNMLFYWADHLQKLTGDRIHCIVVGWGNRGIEDFLSDGTNSNIGWLDLKLRLESIGLNDGDVEGVIFSQGEWDDSRWSVKGPLYQGRFLQWRSEISLMPGITDDTPVYVVQPTDAASFNITDEIFNKLPSREDYPFYVLPTRSLAGDVHFSSLSYEKIGRELLPTIWAECADFSSKISLEIQVSVGVAVGPENDFNVTVDFEGLYLFYSDDLLNWTRIVGAVSPYQETIPRINNKRFYRSANAL